MGKREKNIIARRLVHSYLSSIISISLVLLLVGFFALLAVNARSVSDYFKENMRISLILSGTTGEKRALEIEKAIQGMAPVKATEYISKEDQSHSHFNRGATEGRLFFRRQYRTLQKAGCGYRRGG